MRKIIICLLTLLALTSATAYAGAGHDHGSSDEITKDDALIHATEVIQGFVDKGKIDASWAEVAPATGEKKKGSYGTEWVVSFHNPKIENAAKQTIYVYLTLSGEYKIANFKAR